MRITTKPILFLLITALMLATVPSTAAASQPIGEWAYILDGAGATVTGYSGPGGDVIIPGTLGGVVVTAIGSNVFEGKASLRSVSLPATVTVIGDSAFRGCANLQFVKLPEYLQGTGESAFAGCTGLKSVTIPKWVNNLSAGAFEGCAALTAVYFEGQPPAISATAFNGTATTLAFYGHVTQTGWSSYSDHPVKTYCLATLELMDGTAPAKTALTLTGGKADPAPQDPVRAGYQFSGWYQEAACLNKWNFPAEVIGNDIVLYAKWTPAQCKVTFDSQGGSAVVPILAPYGSPIPAPAEPTYNGFVFGGWYREAACTNAWSIATEPLRSDVTLYARWVVPSTPQEPKAVSIGSSSISVRWKATEYTSGYDIYRALSSRGEYTLVATVYTNSFTDGSLKLGAPYYYRIKPFKQLETTRVYGSDSVVVSAKPVPSAPVAQASHTDGKTVKLTWGAVAGATKYEVWRADKADGPYALVKTLSSTAWWNGGLDTGKEYFYHVRAYAVVKGKKIYGPFGAVVSVKPALPPVG